MKAININSTNQIIFLKQGTHHIKIIGGWGVKLGEFKIELENVNTLELITPHPYKWSAQGTDGLLRSKRILTIDVPTEGNFLIQFKNQETLKLTASSLFLFNLLAKPIDNKNILVQFENA